MEYKIDAILPCSSMDIVMDEVAKVNEEFDLLGILPEQAAFFRDKTVYLPDMAELGIRVPEIYEIVEPSNEPKNYDLPYPVIAKPGLGCGGYGIYVARTEGDLRWFFNNSDDPHGFSERALFYQDRDYRTYEPKSYLHFGYGGRYLIQEYLSGPCISLAGTVSDGVLKLDMAYDIGITSPPTCAEINFGWPSIHPNIEAAITRLFTSFSESQISFPDGAFMADTILHEGELWLVDFSPRMSSSGTKMLYHACGDLSYANNVINATLGETWRIAGTNPTMPTYYSFIPFPKGTLTNVSYPYIEQDKDARIIEAFTPITGIRRVFEMRNDVQVADRGWIVASSTTGTRSDAQNLVEAFIRDIQYDIS
jgi:biotin carboxylase